MSVGRRWQRWRSALGGRVYDVAAEPDSMRFSSATREEVMRVAAEDFGGVTAEEVVRRLLSEHRALKRGERLRDARSVVNLVEVRKAQVELRKAELRAEMRATQEPGEL